VKDGGNEASNRGEEIRCKTDKKNSKKIVQPVTSS
jgi:hypothetical protein